MKKYKSRTIKIVMKGKKSKHKDDDKTQYFGFLPYQTIANMQSDDYTVKIETSQEILDYVPTIPIDEIDVPEFLRFIETYSIDKNMKVAQNCSLIIEAVIAALEPEKVPIHQCVHIACTQMGDSRRFVCQLGNAVIGDLLKACNPHDVLEDIVKSSSTANTKLLIQILRCIANFLSQNMFDPELILDFTFFIDTSLQSPDGDVKQATLWLTDLLKDRSPYIYDKLEKQLSFDGARSLVRTAQNPSTAIIKSRPAGAPQIVRPTYTAGPVEMSKGNIIISQGGYRRPSIPTSSGARKIFSLSRPISSTFASSLDSPFNPQNDILPKPEKFEFESIKLPPPDYGDYEPPKSSQFSEIKSQNYEPLPPIPSPDLGMPPSNSYNEKPARKRSQLGKAHFDDAFFDAPAPKPKVVQKEPPRIHKIRKTAFHEEPAQNESSRFDGHFDEDAIPLPPKGRRSQLEPKKAPSRKERVKFEIDKPVTEEAQIDFENRPIKTSGAYEFDDDDTFSSPLEVRPAVPKRKFKPNTATKFSRSAPVKIKEKAPPKPKTAHAMTVSDMLEKLQSDDWSEQNTAIELLMKSTEGNQEAIRGQLRNSVTSLIDCAGNNRTALAKNALNLLNQWILDKEISFAAVADITAKKLLRLQQSSHHFIVELAGKTFLALLSEIPHARIAKLISSECRGPIAASRAMVAQGAAQVAGVIEDPASLMLPLSFLYKDADPGARKFARMALKTLAGRCEIEAIVKEKVSNQEDQKEMLKIALSP